MKKGILAVALGLVLTQVAVAQGDTITTLQEQFDAIETLYSSQISRHRAAPLLGDRERTTSETDMTISLRACDKTQRDIASNQRLKAVLE